MKPLLRFGRKIPIPSTLQVRRELRVFIAEDEKRERTEAGIAASEPAVAQDSAPDPKHAFGGK